MDRARLYKTEAVVLKQAPVGEKDRILTLYTPYLGKLRAAAKGVRRPGSKLAGHLEPLVHCRLMLARGRNLDVVTQAETIASFVRIRNDLDRIAYAIYCAELVDAFTPDQEANSPVFSLLLDTLGYIEEGETPKCLRYFELHLLRHLGYMLELHRCVECNREIAPEAHAFAPAGGGVACTNCLGRLTGPVLPLSLNALKALRYLQGRQYASARRLHLTASLAMEIEGLLRASLQHLLERELRSTAFLRQLRREEARA
ncbi:MAG: DNA repair protein RecO [Chloroflexi bacterium]|nr:DNA repair protein RecO [Chloroflexota bacterium]